MTPQLLSALAVFGLTRPIFLDFEFYPRIGCNPQPICVTWFDYAVSKEGRMWLWGETPPCPFPMTEDTVFIAYNIAAEISCFLALGWPLPTNAIDLWLEYVQHRNTLPAEEPRYRSGKKIPIKRPAKDILSAMRHFHLGAGPKDVKANFQARAIQGPPWTAQDMIDLPAYCQTDTDMDVRLSGPLLTAVGANDPERMCEVLRRGLYNIAIATEVYAGFPMNCELLGPARKHRGFVQGILIDHLDKIGVYRHSKTGDGKPKNPRIDRALMSQWIIKSGYGTQWPVLDSGLFALDRETIGAMAQTAADPVLTDLALLNGYLGHMRPFDFDVGDDGRCRTSRFPISTKTGRDAPSTTKYSLLTDRGFRGFLRPALGWSIACLDYHSEEMAVGAYMSGDKNLLALAQSSDAYLLLGRIVDLIREPNPVADNYPELRPRLKVASLGLLYDIGIASLARTLNISLARAGQVWRRHREQFPVFWAWAESLSDWASTGGALRTPVFGHTLSYDDGPIATYNGRTARNFGVQAVAGDIIHTVSVFAFLERRPNIHVLGTAHDAVVIEAPTSEINAAVAWMEGIMDRAVKTVLGPDAMIRVKTKITDGPNACDWEDSALFDLLVQTIDRLEKEAAA
jgi:hypothetical protein